MYGKRNNPKGRVRVCSGESINFINGVAINGYVPFTNNLRNKIQQVAIRGIYTYVLRVHKFDIH
jgi:ribosomal protein S9